MTDPKRQVHDFWEEEACGERYGADQDRVRYALEPEILEFADFPSGKGKRVLEIGVGMGADLLRWAQAGAEVTGVDLTERAVEISRRRLAEANLQADVRVGDAEALPFEDGQFDIVYSWGVLHHTPDVAKALSEAERVLAPGGQLKLMLYHRHSWVALAAWGRFCLLRGRPRSTLSDAVTHIESPGTRAFVPDEIPGMLRGLSNVSAETKLTAWDRRWAPGISRLLGDRWGWFLLIQAKKSSDIGHLTDVPAVDAP